MKNMLVNFQDFLGNLVSHFWTGMDVEAHVVILQISGHLVQLADKCYLPEEREKQYNHFCLISLHISYHHLISIVKDGNGDVSYWARVTRKIL